MLYCTYVTNRVRQSNKKATIDFRSFSEISTYVHQNIKKHPHGKQSDAMTPWPMISPPVWYLSCFILYKSSVPLPQYNQIDTIRCDIFCQRYVSYVLIIIIAACLSACVHIILFFQENFHINSTSNKTLWFVTDTMANFLYDDANDIKPAAACATVLMGASTFILFFVIMMFISW